MRKQLHSKGEAIVFEMISLTSDLAPQVEVRELQFETCDSSSHFCGLTGVVLFSILDPVKPFLWNNSNPGKGLAEGLNWAIERRFLGLSVWMPGREADASDNRFRRDARFSFHKCIHSRALLSQPNYSIQNWVREAEAKRSSKAECQNSGQLDETKPNDGQISSTISSRIHYLMRFKRAGCHPGHHKFRPGFSPEVQSLQVLISFGIPENFYIKFPALTYLAEFY
ncbi:hypothetical protein DdX_11948 [Ditylenchus destructor]|uniref:Uncharacterized protein n=1 Tax=Ditylenchus destructor TaxID=166010 RepID=A0AAD4N1A8_9BILA|nr:hypothetical protein DdX_11948 [Ditylenchus destructor]